MKSNEDHVSKQNPQKLWSLGLPQSPLGCQACCEIEAPSNGVEDIVEGHRVPAEVSQFRVSTCFNLSCPTIPLTPSWNPIPCHRMTILHQGGEINLSHHWAQIAHTKMQTGNEDIRSWQWYHLNVSNPWNYKTHFIETLPTNRYLYVHTHTPIYIDKYIYIYIYIYLHFRFPKTDE